MIDNFEPYFEKIAGIHNELFTVLKNMPFVKKETQMFCLQCNYTEYVNEDHDKGYAWFKFCFDNDSSKVFALGINVLRFENKNAEMELAWKELSDNQNVTLSLDLYAMGVLFFRRQLSKQTVCLRY